MDESALGLPVPNPTCNGPSKMDPNTEQQIVDFFFFFSKIRDLGLEDDDDASKAIRQLGLFRTIRQLGLLSIILGVDKQI